jgi:hypothetical protein
MRVAELRRYPSSRCAASSSTRRGSPRPESRATGTFDPDTLEQEITVLQKIVFDLDGVTALDCFALEPGRVAVGDTAEGLGYWTLPRTA